MTEKELTCTHCTSDYNTVQNYKSTKITIRVKCGDKVKEYKVNPWEIL